MRSCFDDLAEQAEKSYKAGVPVEEAVERYVIPDKFKNYRAIFLGIRHPAHHRAVLRGVVRQARAGVELLVAQHSGLCGLAQPLVAALLAILEHRRMAVLSNIDR